MKVREGGRVINVVVLVATGVNGDGHPEVLGLLDTAPFLSPQLVEAMRRGWMPALDEAWPGLRELAQRKGTGKALVKARELLAELASA